MKKIIILSISLWLGNHYNGQTKWIAHKSHSGKMNTFSLKSLDNLGCGRGDFMELKVSNFDVLGNECTRPIILENGMVIKDPKLDSSGFAASHNEVNKLAKMDSTNYYSYKIVYDSIRNVNYPDIKTVKDIELKRPKQKLLFKETPAKKEKQTIKKKNDPTSIIKPIRNSTTPPLEKSEELSPNKTTTKVKSSSLPILPIFLSIIGILTLTLIRRFLFQKEQ